MPKNIEIKFEDCFNLPNPGLRSYFDIVRKGQPDEYRTTFAKGSTVQEVLSDWEPFVNQLADKWPTLVDFENDLRKKVGPMSIMKPLSERLEDIDHYYDDILLPSTPLSERSVKAVIAEWSAIRGLQVRRQSQTIDLMKKSTNSGAPFFTKRRNVVAKTRFCNTFLNTACDPSESLIHMYQGANKFSYVHEPGHWTNFWNACAVLGWRGQEGGPAVDDVKQRVVWMFPFAVNICELMVYQPLIEAAQIANLVPAWVSMEAVDQRITNLFDTKGPEDLVICTDFSKFDQHFNKSLQDAAHDILESIFTHSSPATGMDWWLKDVFPIKYCIPLAYDYGKVRTGLHGMASGSGGTNADETLAHRALQYEAAQSAGQRLNLNSQCLGDDGILSYPGITVEDVVHVYTAHGLEMNESKQYASKQDCTYLRRWHHKDYRIDNVCVGVYSTYRALGRLCEQERYYDPEVWGSKMVALRQLSIIENVKNHPLRDQFAEFCMKRDKYRLGIDIPGFLDNIQDIAKEAIDLMPDFLGYTKSQQKSADVGISSWWIVKYLKSKA
nr:MAG: putative RNA-dependent RNA polymerase [Hubei picobirnavirus 53]